MMEAQEVEPVLAVIHVHEPRLLQVELEAKLRHHIRHRLIGVADILLCLCDDDEVIGKADQGTEVAVVLLPVAVQHPPAFVVAFLSDDLQRLMLVPFGPKPEGTVPEVRFEDGFHDDFRRGLDHLVLYGRQPERPLLAVLLWDIGALHRPGPVVAPFKRLPPWGT